MWADDFVESPLCAHSVSYEMVADYWDGLGEFPDIAFIKAIIAKGWHVSRVTKASWFEIRANFQYRLSKAAKDLAASVPKIMRNEVQIDVDVLDGLVPEREMPAFISEMCGFGYICSVEPDLHALVIRPAHSFMPEHDFSIGTKQ